MKKVTPRFTELLNVDLSMNKIDVNIGIMTPQEYLAKVDTIRAMGVVITENNEKFEREVRAHLFTSS